MRVFIAADVSSKAGIVRLQQEIVATTRWTPNEVKPVEERNFHFTLMFFDESGKEIVNKIKAKLSELQFEPFRLTYTGIGGFPDSNSASNIWVGVDKDGTDKLAKLAGKVVSKMKEIGLEPDKPFMPRITIFHAKAGPLEIGRGFAKYRFKTFGSDVVDKLHLRKSEYGASGNIYSNVFTVNASRNNERDK